MSADLIFLQFLKSLPVKERSFFILMQSYERILTKIDASVDPCKHDAFKIASEVYESEITRCLKDLSITPLSVASKPIVHAIPAIKIADKKFDEKLGEWCSSFSDEDDGDYEHLSS